MSETASKENKTRFRRNVAVGTVAVILLSALAYIWIYPDDPDTVPCTIQGFECYPIHVGYGPGNLIAIEDDGTISSPLVSVNDIWKVDSTYVETTNPTSVPQTTIDRRSSYSALLRGSDNAEAISGEAGLEAVHEVSQRVSRGHRYGLKQGSLLFQPNVLSRLPDYVLDALAERNKSGDSLLFVTEVVEYDSARLEMSWLSTVEGQGKATLRDLFEGLGRLEWRDDRNMMVEYSDPIIVGYRAVSVPRSVIRKADSIKSLPSWYPDGDDDGFGRKGSDPINPGTQPDGYVDNNRDPDDENPRNVPGARRWYRDADGDGFGIADNTKFGRTPPDGYVDNTRDCYDNNGEAHPGQESYFTANRGDGSFDYDCNGSEQKRWTTRGECAGGGRANEGWRHAGTPDCGENAEWLDDCDRNIFNDVRRETSQRTQQCR